MRKTISKTISRYYPKSDGITSSKPNSGYCENGDNFTKITLSEKNSTLDELRNYKQKSNFSVI